MPDELPRTKQTVRLRRIHIWIWMWTAILLLLSGNFRYRDSDIGWLVGIGSLAIATAASLGLRARRNWARRLVQGGTGSVSLISCIVVSAFPVDALTSPDGTIRAFAKFFLLFLGPLCLAVLLLCKDVILYLSRPHVRAAFSGGSGEATENP